MAKRTSQPQSKNLDPTQEIVRYWKHINPEERVSHLIGDATRILTRALQKRLRKSGVSIGHWRFFRALWENGPMTQRELSSWAGVMESTTSIALRSMEQLGYITRTHESGNRKNVIVSLTEEGWRMRDLLTPLALEVNQIALRNVTEVDLAVTRRVLLSIIEESAKDAANLTDAGRGMLSNIARGAAALEKKDRRSLVTARNRKKA